MAVRTTLPRLADPDSVDKFMADLAQEHVLFRVCGAEHLFALIGDRLEAKRTVNELGSYLVDRGIVRVFDPQGDPLPVQQRFAVQKAVGSTVFNHSDKLHQVRMITRSPSFVLKGDQFVERPVGFDIATGTMVMPAAGADVLVANIAVEPGYPNLHRLFSGLMYADPIYQGNLLGILVAGVLRSAIDEFPIILVDAIQKSSGKTQVATALRTLISDDNDDNASITYSGNEHEFECRLGSVAGRPGPNVIHIDNVRAKQGGINRIRSQALSAAVHSHVIKVRKLHVGPVPLADPICIFTMNGARVEGDLSDKSVTVSLIRPPGTDIHRKIIPHPVTEVRAHRLAILAEVRDIIGKIRVQPIVDLHTFTRFYLFEQIVTESAKILGIEASFDPSRVRTTDVTVDELLNLIQDAKLGAEGVVPLKKLSDTLQANPGIRELNEMVQAASRCVEGRVEALKDYIENNLAGHVYRWKGKTVKILLDDVNLTVVAL